MSESAGNGLDGIKVLCVDDDPSARDLIAFALRKHGAVVTTRPSAESAIACLAENLFDVVVSDIMMPPGMDGYDLAHALRKMESEDPTRLATPTLAVSSNATTPSTKKRFADFQVYMTKPFNQKQLVNIVERLSEADSDGVKAGSLANWDQSRL